MKNKIIVWIFVFLLIITFVFAEDEEGIAICLPDWTCTDWSLCINNYQNRTCTDRNFCGVEDAKPVEFKECVASEESTEIVSDETIITTPIPVEPKICIENWKCAPWSICIEGQQTRKCFDSNACGTDLQKPKQGQTCTAVVTPVEDLIEPQQEEPNSLTNYLYILISLILLSGLVFFGYKYFLKKTITKPQIQKQELLIKYINQMKAAGFDNLSIRNELIKAGYGTETINQYFPSYNPQLKKFTKQMIDKGYNFNQIEDHLSVYGYMPEQIQEHFKNIK